MKGGRVAYHLRPNKAVDRHLFVDLLTRIHGFTSLARHNYVGLGGPFLEDFRLIHSHFGISKLISVEAEVAVWKRQKFNRPLSSIKCLQTTSGDFIATYDTTNNAIIWLDYASEDHRREQLEEVQLLLTKLQPSDVLKITVNANPETLGYGNLEVDERLRRRVERLKEVIGDFLPPDILTDSLDNKGFARLLYGAILRAARAAFSGVPDLGFLPLTAFRYSDSSHQMLTVTGIVIKPSEHRRFLQRTGIKRWKLAIGDSTDPILINVPLLSVRERLFVDARLPAANGRRITKALGFWCGEDEAESIEIIDSYARFYRHFPYFSRVVP
jgi:hypothetical protein